MATADTLLKTYNAKRDFTRTAEPKGKAGRAKGNSFIVQKHDATRLHYDFRLEMDGVLKSWAVTRGPSPDPDDKRLAVRTEDHPLSYAAFEGVIPKGEYGGGTVMLWDEGTWTPAPGKDPRKTLKEGHLHFTLDGARMKGEWLLIRLKQRGNEKRENWLLRKIDDRHAGHSDDLVARELTSVASGRTMAQIAANAPAISLKGKKGKAFDKAMAQASEAVPARPKPAPKRRSARRAGALPAFRQPQLATLVDHVPGGSEWMHEIKFDGYRCLLAVAGGKARIYTRSGLDWSDRFPSIVAAAKDLGLSSALIDGEIVTLDADGNPSFSALQETLSEGRDDFTLFTFDLLEKDGEDLSALGNLERKERLAALVPDDGPIRLSQHVVGAGEKLFAAMCDAGQEGIISKRCDAPYAGRRTRSWLKVKCTRRQELVIVGWIASTARGRGIKSLALAQYQGGTLTYAGRVGTGFSGPVLEMLEKRLAPLGQISVPLKVPKSQSRGIHWVKPELVAEIAYAQLTADGILRHASFLGLREDKDASDVTPEEPMPLKQARAAPAPAAVKISNRQRIIFPEARITKGELADYYEAVGDIMLPWITRRPISLVRCPQGRAKQCFFQKHDSGSFGDAVHHIPIKEKGGKKEDYIYIDSVEGILACVQMGTIEFHGWGSLTDAVEKPDRMVFDLDPDEGLGFKDVKKAARDIRTQLSDIGLVSFPMLSGGKGIHVVVPLTPKAQWPAVKDFADRFARALAQAEPDRFTATMSKAKRKDRIFIDWLRNQRGSTAILPYSARARANAPVAVPIAWDELDDIDRAGLYTIKDIDTLLERASGRALSGWGEADQTLPDL